MKAMIHFRPKLCQKCFNKHLQAKGEEPPTNVKWRQIVEKKAYRGRMLKMICAGCGNSSPGKDRRQRSFGNWPTKKTRREYKVSGSRITSQRILGASEVLPRDRLQRICDEERLHRLACKQYTSYVTFSHAVNTHSLLHITLHGSRVGARFVSSEWSSVCAT